MTEIPATNSNSHISEKIKISKIFNPFSKPTWYFLFLEKKKDWLDSLNISEVLDSEKFSYLNVKKQLLHNNLRQWAHSRVPNTAQIYMAALLSYFSINPRQIESENMPVNEIENLRTFCKQVDAQ